ncbi:hypothetical protein ACJJI4_06790 [Microbulbifer sp. TRSA002]|uniref:hypothetical protein n=1 Tax=Microbulbifer sp. TRSA002 TaxID=3243382 RepID=UPI0040394AB8
MKEVVLKEFFEGTLDIDALVADLSGSSTSENDTSHVRIQDMESEFVVRSEHVVKICNAALNNKLSPTELKNIGFCLLASDTFEWNADTVDGSRVADVLFYFSSPEINYELNYHNIGLFKSLLINGGNPLEQSI